MNSLEEMGEKTTHFFNYANNLDLANLKIVANHNLNLNTDNNIGLQDYELYTNDGNVNIESLFGDVALKAGSFTSLIQSVGKVDIKAAGNIDSQNNKIIAVDDINLTANQNLILKDQIINSIFSNVNLTANLGDIHISSDLAQSFVSADQDLKIETKLGNILIDGNQETLLQSLNVLQIKSAGNLDLQNNQLYSTVVKLTSAGTLNLAHQEIFSEDTLDINSDGTADLNSVKIKTAGKINITSFGNLTLGNNNIQSVFDDVNLTSLNANLILNNDQISSGVSSSSFGQDVNLTAKGDITNNSSVFAKQNLNLLAYNLTNNKILAAGNDINAIIENNLLNQNQALIFAGNNIDLQVVGTLTNDNSAIYALSGDVLLNGKKKISDVVNVDPYIFANINFAFSDEILNDLKAKGYIDANGNLTDAFYALNSVDDFDVSSDFSYYKTNIFNALKAKAASVALASDGRNFIGQIQNNFDYLAPTILDKLISNGYIDANGNLTTKFYSDTNALDTNGNVVGYEGLNLNDESLDCCFKGDIYDLLVLSARGKILENNFIGITGSTDNARLLLQDLQNHGYVDANGNATSAFSSLSSAADLNLSNSFSASKQDIYDLIKNAGNIAKIAEDNFNNITKQVTQTNTQNFTNQDVFDSLLQSGYVNNGGNVDNNFPSDISNFTLPVEFDSEKQNIFNLLTDLKNNNQTLDAASLNPISYQTQTTTTVSADKTAILNFLKDNGYVDSNGKFEDKYYINDANIQNDLSANFSGFESQIAAVLASIPQATINQNSVKNINQNLSSSIGVLLSDLYQNGYIDGLGKVTAKFNNLSGASDLQVNEDFLNYKQVIFDQIKNTAATNVNHNFVVTDFIGNNFDSTIFYDQNQQLFSNLVSEGYLDHNGNVTKKFSDLSGNYNNLVVDNAFGGLKDQIGQFLANIPKSNLKLSDISSLAQNQDQNQSKLIQDVLVNNGYLTADGGFTDKLKNDVFGHSISDSQNAAQLDLGTNLADLKDQVYLALKNKRDNNLILTKSGAVINQNKGNIKSLLGDVGIFANQIQNLSKDNYIVNESAIALSGGSPIFNAANENAITRTMSGILNRAWNSTVLYQTEYVTSKLTSESSYISAGRNVTLEADNILNKGSVITSGLDMNIKANNFDNHTTSFNVAVRDIYESHSKHCKRFRGCVTYVSYPTSWREVKVQSNVGAVISSGGSLNLDIANNLSNSATNSYSSKLGDVPAISAPSSNQDVNGSATLANDTINLPSSLLLPDSESKLFSKADANSPYLFTSSDIVAQRQFTGSEYYKVRFGFDPNVSDVRVIGDPFYQFNFVNQQINQMSKTAYAWQKFDAEGNSLTWEDNLNQLIENAYAQNDELKLTPGVALTADQIARLRSDIVWYEEIEVDDGKGGKTKVLAPKVYLASNNLDNFNPVTGSMILGKVVKINAGDFNNGGSVFAKSDMSIKTANNLNSTNGIIDTKGNLIIDSQNNINLKNTLLSAGGLMALNAKNDISVINDLSFKKPLSLNNSLSSFSISALGFKDDAADRRAAATFNAGTDIQVTSSGTINIANNYFNSGGSIFMNAVEDINNSNFTIKADENVVMSAKNINNIAKLTAKDLPITTSNETRIEAGKMVSLDATNNINNIGATIKAGELVYLTAGNNITNKASIDYAIGGRSVTESQALSSNADNIKSTLIAKGNIESDGNIVLVANNNINNIGSDIKANNSGSIYLEATNGNINISTAQARNKTTIYGGTKKNAWTSVSDKVTNIQSEVNAGDDLIMVSGNNTNIIGSKIKATNDINVNAGGNLNIINAKDSTLSSMDTYKKGFAKAKKTESGSYSETAVKSEIEANKINLSADGDILVRSSDLKSKTDLNIGMNTLAKDSSGAYQTDSSGNYLTTSNNLVNNLVIADDTLNSYSYSNTSKSFRGIAKVGVNITSTVIGLVDMVANLSYNLTMLDPTNRLLNDLGNKVSEKILPDSLAKYSDAKYLRDKKNDLKDNQFYNIRQKENFRTDQTKVSSSTISAGNDLNIHTNDDTTIIASNLKSGTDASATTGATNITADNLNILADQDTTLTDHKEMNGRTLSFSNWNDGSFSTGKVTNSTLTAKNDNFNFNIAENIKAGYDAQIFDSKTGVFDNTYANKAGVDTSALQYLTHVKTNHDSQTLYNPITEQQKQWEDATRGLTGAGTALIAVAAVAATIITAGALAPVTAGAVAAGTATFAAGATFTVTTAVAGAALSTAAVSATNTSMNAEGDVFKQTKDIGKQTLKDTTSKEALKSYAIAGATAFLTAGITAGISELSTASSASSSTATAGTTTATTTTSTTASTSATATTATTSATATTATAATTTTTNTITTAIKNSLIQSVSSSVAESTINGDSFSEAFKNSTKNLLINAAGAIAANQIGSAAHGSIKYDAGGNPIYVPPTIGQPLQLALHAALGCGMAAAGGNDCASGAAAGVMGELTAGYLDRNTNLSSTGIIEGSKLSGALAAAMVAGPDDGGSVFAGSQIARNAAENNYLTGKIFGKDVEKKLDNVIADLKGKSLDYVADRYVESNDPIEKVALFSILATGQVGIPANTTELELMIATAGIAKGFAPEIAAGLNKVDGAASEFFAKFAGKVGDDASKISLSNFDSLSGANPSEISSLIPKDWISMPLKKGDGIRYINPNKPGEAIMIENGWSNATDPLHSGPYLRISRDGKVTRIPLNGNPTLNKQ